ncbi:hypothetical protein LFM09_32040 [Lentzea alba]|uniref:hypothetical protein n=1 Tax=Lentzea alba TaxID=2714351 RepID=UPI0039BF3371
MNSRRWWLALGAFVVAIAGVLIWLSRSDDALDQGDKLASITGALLALAGLVATVVLGLRANAARTPTSPALEDLARLVARQWEREAGARGLTRQEPLKVSWASTERPVAPSAAEVVGAEAMAAKPVRLKLHGGVGDLAEALQKLPGHQLVVLGEPGSGKTSAAILLTLRLLAQRQPGDPVPVMFSLASWDPTGQDLETWMAQRIAVDHPVFRKRGAHGPEAARDLVERGMVLPVLDALDEVALRVEAIAGIAGVVGRNKPVVLTCRTDDYERLIGSTGMPVGRAAVVELATIEAGEAARYLEAGAPDGDRRWQPVAARLRQERDGVLARALSTPLAVYLAKTAFTPLATRPEDLLDLPTASAVERHLLEAYLPALYPAKDAADARKWLSFLARRLSERPKAGNLAWWRLFLLLPRPHLIVGAARAAWSGAVFFTVLVVFASLTDLISPTGAEAGLLVLAAAVFGTVAGRLEGAVPLPTYLEWRTAMRHVMINVLVGVAGAMTVGWLASGIAPVTLATGALLGVAVGARLGAKKISVDVPVDPHGGLIGDRRTTIVLTLWTPAILGTAALVLMISLDVRSIPVLAPAVGLVMLGALCWPHWGAWVNFNVVRVWFALGRKLPWRLMEFLVDAHKRGVLRQVGAAYEFRHQRLQQYFSGSDRS